MIVILDTDHLTVIQRQTEPAYSNLRARLLALPAGEVGTTVINFEEQMRGWLAIIARARTARQEVEAYERLHAMLAFFASLPVLKFDEAAADRLAQLKRARLRIGTMDLKIAAVALSQGCLLLSCNLKDFQQVPGLMVEDWTR